MVIGGGGGGGLGGNCRTLKNFKYTEDISGGHAVIIPSPNLLAGRGIIVFIFLIVPPAAAFSRGL